MKARTASAKRKAKRGRPPIAGVEREPNGRPRRMKESMRKAMTESEARSVVVEQRIKRDNIVAFKQKDGKVISPEEQAADPRRGYVLGLMWIDATIREHQHEAGIRYAQDISRYLGLKGLPFPSPRAQNLFAVRGHDGEESESRVEAAQKAEERFKATRKALLAVGDIDTGRKVERKVAEVCVQDIMEARTWPEPTLLLLRKGLNALAFHYGVVDSKAKP